MVKSLVTAAGILFAAVSVDAQSKDDLVVINGSCSPKSGVSIGGAPSDKFACDTAVVARSARGTVLIQFTDKAGVDGRILGFAGEIAGRQKFGADPAQFMGVERLYLKGGGEPLPTSRGECILTWKSGKLVAIVCGGLASYQGQEIQAVGAIRSEGQWRN